MQHKMVLRHEDRGADAAATSPAEAVTYVTDSSYVQKGVEKLRRALGVRRHYATSGHDAADEPGQGVRPNASDASLARIPLRVTDYNVTDRVLCSLSQRSRRVEPTVV